MPAILRAAPYDSTILKSRNRDYPHEGRLAFENRTRRSGAFGEKHSDMKYVRHASEKLLVRFQTSRVGDWLTPRVADMYIYTRF